MSKKQVRSIQVPEFYRKLGREAMTAYRRRKSLGEPTGHFTVVYANVKYVFWKIGYDEVGNQVQMRPLVDEHIKKMDTVCVRTGIVDRPPSWRLEFFSLNKPRTK